MIYRFLQELQPPDFTSIDSWTTLAIALLVVLAVAAAPRRTLRHSFLLVAFAVAAYVAFRSARDAWFLVVTGLPTSRSRSGGARRWRKSPPRTPLLVALGTTCVVALAAFRFGVSRELLDANLARSFPVGAAAFVESEGLPGPMLNHYDWGG